MGPVDTSALFRMQLNYEWWFAESEDAEVYAGKAATRQEAFDRAKVYFACDAELNEETGRFEVSFTLIEGAKEPLRLSEYIGFDPMIEAADEAILDSEFVTEDDEPPFFGEPAAPLAEDLKRRIRAACDEWQIANAVFPTTRCVSAVRSCETVKVDVTEERAAADAAMASNSVDGAAV